MQNEHPFCFIFALSLWYHHKKLMTMKNKIKMTNIHNIKAQESLTSKIIHLFHIVCTILRFFDEIVYYKLITEVNYTA